MIKEESIMAEDLKIRVKVEPNTTGLQGKLDEAAKNYKLNVELFDNHFCL